MPLLELSRKGKEMLSQKMSAEKSLTEINEKMMAYISINTLEETVQEIMGPLMTKIKKESENHKEIFKRLDG